ncbi:MAG: RluA family pseudouridine synthase [Xanthomonadales bacterium]|jgi:23S rRNA pseudouridine955/2504/2580 synthase|nr:RluA family pseudouridine synthase [Xanthomonadales bacterium]
MSNKTRSSSVRMETVDHDHDGQRVDNFLSARMKGLPRSLIYRLIRTGQVRINGKRCKPASRLDEGDQVRIPPARLKEKGEADISDRVLQQLKACILHEDSDSLVINKPSGMAVHAGSGLPWGMIDVVRRIYPDQYLELVHRLDRETSGCLVLARNGSSLQHLSTQFREGRADKRYLCLLDGMLSEPVVDVDVPLARVQAGQKRQVEVSPEGKAALTRFHLLQALCGASYAEAELLTGRTHQIRVHALHLGMPLAGDQKYAGRASLKTWRARGLRRIFLHAHSLRIENVNGQAMDFYAPLPQDLRAVLSGLE